MVTVEDMVALLRDAIAHPSHLPRDVQQFQHAMWEAPRRDAVADPRVWAVLEELAYTLTRFAPDEEVRRVDPSYYGSERALREIRAALAAFADQSPAAD